MKRRISAVILALTLIMSTYFTVSADDLANEIKKLIPDITNVSTSSTTVELGSDFKIDFRFINTAVKPIYDTSFVITDMDELELIEGGTSISRLDIDKTYSYKFNILSTVNKSKIYLRYKVYFSYDDENDKKVDEERSFSTIINVKSKNTVSGIESPLEISNIKYPESIINGTDDSIKFDIINKNNTSSKNVEYKLYKGNKLLHTEYIGEIKGQSKYDFDFTNTFSGTGKTAYKIEVTYESSEGQKLKLEKDITINITEVKSVELSNIIIPEKIVEKTVADITFNVVNKNKTTFQNTEAALYKNNKLVSSTYIGTLNAQSMVPATISYKFAKGESGKYTIKLTYNDHIGELKSIQKNIEINVEAIDDNSDEQGILKIQSLTPPLPVLISTMSSVSFAVTNPSVISIKGVEAYLYDYAGNEINSIYVSEIPANTSSNLEISFKSSDKVGVSDYKIKIVYSDTDTEHVLSKNFSVTTVLEKVDDPTIKEKDSNIKIQKINAPGSIYTNVKTEIPFTLVNAGKGTAYNVEVYVMNSNNEEVAREYIGNIISSESRNGSFKLKFIEKGEYDLTLYTTYENADDTTGKVEKSFSQQVIDYRASILDVAGYEWITAGFEATIEFAVLNSGSEILRNTFAVLTDADGNKYGEVYIGNIDPGIKKERQRFRNIIFPTAGVLELTLQVTYENTDLQQFNFSTLLSANVQEQYNYIPEEPIDDPTIPVDGVVVEEQGSPLIIILIIAGSLVIVAIVIIIIVRVRKKKKLKSAEEDELDSYLNDIKNSKSDFNNNYDD